MFTRYVRTAADFSRYVSKGMRFVSDLKPNLKAGTGPRETLGHILKNKCGPRPRINPSAGTTETQLRPWQSPQKIMPSAREAPSKALSYQHRLHRSPRSPLLLQRKPGPAAALLFQLLPHGLASGESHCHSLPRLLAVPSTNDASFTSTAETRWQPLSPRLKGVVWFYSRRA